MKQIKLSTLHPNPAKPVKRYPKFLEKRPIVIESFQNPVILGGNMRFRALTEIGYKEIPQEWVKEAKDFTDEEKRAFIIIDNVEYGEEDWDKLANEWDENELKDWGLELKFLPKDVDRMLKLDPNIEIKRNGKPYIKQDNNSEITANAKP